MHEVDGWVDEEMQKVSSWEKKSKFQIEGQRCSIRLQRTLHASCSGQTGGMVCVQLTPEAQVWCLPLQVKMLKTGSGYSCKLPEGSEGRAVVRPGIKEVGSEGAGGLLAA